MAGSGASDAEIARHMGRDVKLVGRKRREIGVERGISEAMLRMLRRVNARRTVARNEMTEPHRGGFPNITKEANDGRC
tara:strand:- start:13417 stop:13650 length:234 start_codon:yes stop_codon:yes gene_type:complete